MIRKFPVLTFFIVFFNQNASADDNMCVQNGGKVPCSIAEQYWKSPRGEDSYNYNDFLHYACMGTYPPTECFITGTSIVEDPYGNMPMLAVDVKKRYYYYDPEADKYVFHFEQEGLFSLGSYRRCPPNHLDERITSLPHSSWKRVCKPYNYTISVDKIIPNESKEPKNMCSAKNGSATVADPIDIASGNKTLSEVDYKYNAVQELMIKRDYSSFLGVWRFDFQRGLTYSNINGEYLVLERQNGQKITLKKINGIWQETNSNLGFSANQESNGNIKIITPSLETEIYEVIIDNGDAKTYRLSLVENNKKQKWLYEYSGMSLVKISNDYGRELLLEYGSMCKSVPISITVTGGKKYQYEYTGYCNLTKVTYPDLTFKEYLYEALTNNFHSLTKVIDENKNISQVTTYNNIWATSESMGSTNAIEKISLNYSYPNKVELRDGNNNLTTVNTEKVNNFTRITGYDSYCPTCTGFQGSQLSYNSNGFVSGVKDYKNTNTSFEYNSVGNISQIKNAVGTSLEKQINYTYDVSGKYITTKTEPVSGGNKVTSYTYDSNNNITKISVVAPKNDGTNSNITKEINLIYDLDQVIEIRGVNYNSNPNDKITMTYNSDGQVNSITNELGQVTTYSSYDDYGNPTQIILPNSTVINFTYDLRGRLTSSSISSSLNSNDSETTTYTYDLAGLLIKITNPSGTFSKLSYDTAHRLTKVEEYSKANIENPNGVYLGKVEYTLDNMSKPTSIKVFNAQNVQERVSTSQYDNKNRLFKTIGTLNQTTTYQYDENSNLKNITDAGNYSFGKTYDALNRVVSMTYPDNSTVFMSYNSSNQISSVTDPKGLVTNYTYDGFDNVIKIESPDTGITLLSYDKKNNLISKQDNKNQISTYTYDLLDRLKTVNYTGTNYENITLTYDVCKVGSICSISDSSGNTTYSYDSKARITSKKFIPIGENIEFTTSYSYDNFGNVSNITYPSINASGFMYSGSSINYTYENDKVKNIAKTNNISIVSNVEYEVLSYTPKSFDMGIYNYSQNVSQDGIVQGISNSQSNSYNKDYTHDSRFNVKTIKDKNNPINKNLTVTYDSKSRIIETNHIDNGVSTNFKYGYNTSDDRTSITKNNITDTYIYPSNSHKLSSVNGLSNFTYDLNGNIITASDSNQSITYDNANRLVTNNSNSGNAIYTYNALNQRMKKVVNKGGVTETTWFVYDESGKLIADYVNRNGIWSVSEYIYLYDKPVAVIRDSQIYHIQTDHLNTPRSITKDIDGSLVWNWENKEVFGNNLPNENLSANLFKFNLRFPGQYWDDEKNTSYNYHRDYAPGLGRYIQSDPIGLNGGFNTYGYVGGNPLSYIDPEGLFSMLTLTTTEGLKRNTSLDDAVRAGALTRLVTMPAITIGLSPSFIGLAGSSMIGVSGVLTDICFNPNELIHVSRWGASRPNGLQNGDWVMKGGNNYWNYFKSGKWEKHRWNEYAPYSSGKTYQVKRSELSNPSSLKNPIIDGKWKKIYGQRIYNKE